MLLPTYLHAQQVVTSMQQRVIRQLQQRAVVLMSQEQQPGQQLSKVTLGAPDVAANIPAHA
jgi:hypothetical protein